MKKLTTLLLFFFVLFNNNSKAQYVNIADTNFRNFLISTYPACFNTAQQLDTNCTSITTVTTLLCSHSNFISIDGVQYFDNLKTLDCSFNSLLDLPKLPKSLTSLTCNNNRIGSITNLPLGLKRLLCQFQDTTSFNLPTIPNTLTIFSATYNKLLQLPSLPNTIDSLLISGCNLLSLTSLPITLKTLDCSQNSLSILPNFPSSLKYINCSGNTSITSLPSLPATLNELYVDGLTNVLPNSLTIPTTLTNFSCNYCNWSSLPTFPNGLLSLTMSYNNFPIFPTNLPSSITTNGL